MTPAQIRGTTLAYFQLKELMGQPLHSTTKQTFEEFFGWAENACADVVDKTEPARWAAAIVGPVRAAAVGAAATWERGEIPRCSSALRVFGLIGEHALSNDAAFELMRPYLFHPTVPEAAISEMARRSGLLLKLRPNPTPVEALEELTRPRTGVFPVKVSYWLADHFRLNSTGVWADAYRSSLAGLRTLNEAGENMILTSQTLPTGRITADEWCQIIRGRISMSRLELRAGYSVARKFVSEYWEFWNLPK